MSLSRWFYSLLLYLLTPLVIARLWLRSLRAPEYRRRIAERFGFGPVLPRASEVLWVHAVSLGEARAAIPIVRALRLGRPTACVLLTTTTPTGARSVQDTFGADPLVSHRYVPYDLPGALRRFLDCTQPQLLIVMETELWPNLMHLCRRRGVAVILANARLSERSVAGYRRFPALTRETLHGFLAIAAQTGADAERFRQLGAPAERLRVIGNIKFDLQLPAGVREEALSLRRELFPHRPVWIAASTHEGEEEAVLAAHAELQRTLPDALLLLVPRHPERFQRVAALCQRMGFVPVTWSSHQPVPTHCSVYLGDTMGRLPLFYAAADAAFVGGSLVTVGGHNPLEPAALGIPVAFGPHCFNFAEITSLLLEANAAQAVRGSADLAATMVRWLQDERLRITQGERGQRVVADNRGALTALMAIIGHAMGVGSPRSVSSSSLPTEGE